MFSKMFKEEQKPFVYNCKQMVFIGYKRTSTPDIGKSHKSSLYNQKKDIELIIRMLKTRWEYDTTLFTFVNNVVCSMKYPTHGLILCFVIASNDKKFRQRKMTR